MKNIMLRQVLICVCLASSPLAAMAGDSWTGGFVGVQYGSASDSTDLAWSPTIRSQAFNLSGNVYGLHAGYNFAASANTILGVEAQYSLSDAEGKNPCSITTYTCGAILDNLTTVRGRFGYAGSSVMVYALLGYGMADVEVYDSSPGVGRFGETNTVSGPLSGVGIAIQIASNVSIGLEYTKLYFDKEIYKVDLGSKVEVDYAPTSTVINLDWHF